MCGTFNTQELALALLTKTLEELKAEVQGKYARARKGIAKATAGAEHAAYSKQARRSACKIQ